MSTQTVKPNMVDSKSNSAQNVSLVSMNCRGLADHAKRRDVLHYLRAKRYSIYCLQDVHCTDEMEGRIRAEWGSDCYFSSFKSNSRGVAILFNNTFEYKVLACKADPNGNFLALSLDIHDSIITLINLYGPNKDDPNFYETVNDTISEYNNPHTVICGDWNLVLNDQIDCFNYVNINNPSARQKVLDLCNHLELVDPWRIQNPNSRVYTWRQHTTAKQSRLDFFLISSEMNSKLVSCDIKPGYRTDHSMVDLHFDFNQIERGPGYWKFNNSLLKDATYVDQVKTVIKKVVEKYAARPYLHSNLGDIHAKDIHFIINDQLFFEMLLMEIRSKTISYAAWKNKNSRKDESNLEKEIKILTEKVAQGDGLSNEMLKSKQADLVNLRRIKMDGVLLRAKTRWMEHGEKPSRYFLNMEKRNCVNRSINRITTENNTELNSSCNILNEARLFYKKLYSLSGTVKEEDLQSLFENSDSPVLSNLARDSIEGPLSHHEILNALKKSKNGKSPGSDGFTFEFFKFFFSDLSWFLLRSLNFGYKAGKLSVTQQYGILTLLPKGEKPRQFLKNWRPISLLNITYKLASSCIAERIKTCLHSIINEQQRGFLEGRYIGENIRLMYDLLNYTENNKIPGLLLLIDFEKAFDSVSHDFILKILDLFNFGPSIQRWFQVLYNGAKASVLVNGFLSESFPVERGCRQGDGLSPYLFLLCAEILGKMVRRDNILKGIMIEGSEYRLSQYADDTVFILDGSESSFVTAFKILESFASMSGLKVNIEKTNAVWIGGNKGRQKSICSNIEVKWVDPQGSFRALGIDFVTNLENMTDINYNNVLGSIHTAIGQWSKRNLTVLGRITIVKSLILSKLTFLALTLPDPSKLFIKNLDSLLFKFIWRGVDRVTRNQMIQNYSQGGVKMVDLRSYINSLKCTWIRRLLQGTCTSGWRLLFMKLSNIQNLLFLEGGHVRIAQKFQRSAFPNRFWLDVLTGWSSFVQNHQTVEQNDSLTNILWYNHRIKINHNCVHYKHWSNKGIYYVCDLLDEKGAFLTLDNFMAKFNVKTNFLEYRGIINAVRKSFGLALKGTKGALCLPLIPFNFRFLWKDKKGCSRIYNCLCSSKKVSYNFIAKWETKLNVSFTNLNWMTLCNIPFSSTKDTRLRWFQFRLVHRILGVNSFLAKIGKKDNGLCTFCQAENETLIHLFCKCEISSTFWSQVKDWIEEVLGGNLFLDDMAILFGIRKKSWSAVNLILLLGRFHMYKMKMMDSKPSLKLFKEDVKQYYVMEKYTSLTNGWTAKFNAKWDALQTLF